jgi:glycosyltransferase involved in cell wall biosynthesis
MSQITICHLTSVHPRFDTRIYYKECKSLAKAGYQVSLIVADGIGDEINDYIKIYDVGKPKGRLQRIAISTRKVFRKAKLLNADIYHLHDPELMLIGLKLKKLGKIVIFDAHEDLPKQLLSKPYLTQNLRKLLSHIVEIVEKRVCEKFNVIVTATPFIKDKFLKINNHVADINNFPILGELFDDIPFTNKCNQVCYIGGIAKIRGILEMVKAMEFTKTNTQLILAGVFGEADIEKEVKSYKGWLQVNELGFIDRQKVKEILSQSIAGLVTLLPTLNYIDSLPIKMFEYMSAGLPVIASNFPLWQQIIEKNNCGICVDPLNPTEISKAIEYLVENPEKAKEMGQNGKIAVEKYYNWTIEEKKLLELYSSL